YDENANEHMFVATHRGACKRMAYDSVEKTNRARRGSQLIRPLKTKPHKLVYIDTVSLEAVEEIYVVTDQEKTVEVDPLQLPVNERNSNGSFVLDEDEDGNVMYAYKNIDYESPFAENE